MKQMGERPGRFFQRQKLYGEVLSKGMTAELEWRPNSQAQSFTIPAYPFGNAALHIKFRRVA